MPCTVLPPQPVPSRSVHGAPRSRLSRWPPWHWSRRPSRDPPWRPPGASDRLQPPPPAPSRTLAGTSSSSTRACRRVRSRRALTPSPRSRCRTSSAASATRCCSGPVATGRRRPSGLPVGYYTEVAGLGASPGSVTINGHVDVYNRCLPAAAGVSDCTASGQLLAFLSNLTINVPVGAQLRAVLR